MNKRVKTFDVEDKKLVEGAKSKTSKVKESASQAEVEKFGIVEINNGSAKAKGTKKADAGFEKNTSSCSKKPVKSNLHVVDDYFDFDLRANSKKSSALKMKSEDVEVIKEKSSAVSQIKEKSNEERYSATIAEAADRVAFDDAATYNITVARIGSLFDCEKRMIN